MNSKSNPQLLVVCLCADWCTLCNEYRATFDTLILKFPQVKFLWVDIEEEADLIDPIEVRDFPTILISKDQRNESVPLFFGTVLPHIETLERLIQDKLDHGNPLPVANVDVYKLAKSLKN